MNMKLDTSFLLGVLVGGAAVYSYAQYLAIQALKEENAAIKGQIKGIENGFVKMGRRL